jgi:hypothetical protein
VLSLTHLDRFHYTAAATTTTTTTTTNNNNIIIHNHEGCEGLNWVETHQDGAQ